MTFYKIVKFAAFGCLLISMSCDSATSTSGGSTPECSATTLCKVGQGVCDTDAGKCEFLKPGDACTADEASNCGSGTCTDDKCVASLVNGKCQSPTDCADEGSPCTGGTCRDPDLIKCEENSACTESNEVCFGGRCHLITGTGCSVGVATDSACVTNVCARSTLTSLTKTCQPAAVDGPCASATDCTSGYCDTTMNQCALFPNGNTCSTDSQCGSDYCDTTTKQCTAKRVLFLTSKTHLVSDLTSTLSNWDSVCSIAAAASNVASNVSGKTFVALVSTSTQAALDRVSAQLTDSNKPIADSKGNVLFNTTEKFSSGNIASAGLIYDETAAEQEYSAWTGSTAVDIEAISNDKNCADWANASGTAIIGGGSLNSEPSSLWNTGTLYSCDKPGTVMCISVD